MANAAFVVIGLAVLVWLTRSSYCVRRDDPFRIYQRVSTVGVALYAAAAETEDGGILPTDICDDDGRPLLSWRVKILPFLKQDGLYRRFRLDEPWDSPHNRKLVANTPESYQLPGSEAPAGYTYFKVLTGPGGWFGKRGQANLNRVVDGTTNTIMVIAGGDPVPWTKPEDISYDPKQPLPNLSRPGYPDEMLVMMGDLFVRSVNRRTVSEKSIRAAITWNANDTLGPDW